MNRNAIAGAVVDGTLVFQNGETVKTIEVPLINDAIREPVETFRVVLSNPSAGAGLGVPSSVLVRIQDSDPGFSLNSLAYTVSETAEEVILYVSRPTDAAG